VTVIVPASVLTGFACDSFLGWMSLGSTRLCIIVFVVPESIRILRSRADGIRPMVLHNMMVIGVMLSGNSGLVNFGTGM
jgi:hypothetical protein